MMAFMASPFKAFLPPSPASRVLRHVRMASTSTSTPNNLGPFYYRGVLPPAAALPPFVAYASSNGGVKVRSRRMSLALSASDSAKDAAMAAVQAAEDALNLAAEDAGAAAVGTDEVHATVAAARAAARSAMDSLRRGGSGFGGEGDESARVFFASRQVILLTVRGVLPHLSLAVVALFYRHLLIMQ